MSKKITEDLVENENIVPTEGGDVVLSLESLESDLNELSAEVDDNFKLISDNQEEIAKNLNLMANAIAELQDLYIDLQNRFNNLVNQLELEKVVSEQSKVEDPYVVQCRK